MNADEPVDATADATAGAQAAAGLAKLKGVFKSFNGRVEVRATKPMSR